MLGGGGEAGSKESVSAVCAVVCLSLFRIIFAPVIYLILLLLYLFIYFFTPVFICRCSLCFPPSRASFTCSGACPTNICE